MIFHIDMDAFYASVEQLDNPELRGKCVVVGGLSGRGVVSAANYEVRKFGVKSAMPMYRAKLRCPHGFFLSPRISRYKEISNQVMGLLKNYSPLVEQVSIDEAYIDLSGCTRLYGEPVALAAEMKEKIKKTVNLTCSVGVAPNKVLAKIASDMNKPDGLFVILPEHAKSFIESLTVNKLPGVGKTTGKKLKMLGVKTVADVKKLPAALVEKKLGKFGRRLLELAECIDHSPVTPVSSRKSVSTETTLAEDTNDRYVLKKHLLSQSQEVGRQLRKFKVRAKTVTLKIKHDDFTLKTKSHTMKTATQSSETLYKEAAGLLDTCQLKNKIRLIGVGTSGFIDASVPVQMDLFREKKNPGWEKVDRTVDAIEEKFGKGAVKRAALTDDRED